MFEILWLESAINDLVRLRAFLAEVNPPAASKEANLIKNATIKLQEFPLIGKAVEDIENFYDLFIEFGSSGYHLRYSFFDQKIYIVHIKHTRKLEYS